MRARARAARRRATTRARAAACRHPPPRSAPGATRRRSRSRRRHDDGCRARPSPSSRDPGCTRPRPTRRWPTGCRTPRARARSAPRRRAGTPAPSRRRTRTTRRPRSSPVSPGCPRRARERTRGRDRSHALLGRATDLIALPGQAQPTLLRHLDRQRVEPALRWSGELLAGDREPAVVTRAEVVVLRAIPPDGTAEVRTHRRARVDLVRCGPANEGRAEDDITRGRPAVADDRRDHVDALGRRAEAIDRSEIDRVTRAGYCLFAD